MSTTGRPRALDEIKRRQICALISAGCSLREAARYVRCGRATLQRELSRNAEFRQQIDEAATASSISPLKAMQKAAGTHWRAAAWLLERTKPERYSRRDPQPMKKRLARRLLDRILEIVRNEVPDPNVGDRLKHRIRDAFEEAIAGTVKKEPDEDDLRRALQFLEREDRQRMAELVAEPTPLPLEPSTTPNSTPAAPRREPTIDPFFDRSSPTSSKCPTQPMSTVTLMRPFSEQVSQNS